MVSNHKSLSILAKCAFDISQIAQSDVDEIVLTKVQNESFPLELSFKLNDKQYSIDEFIQDEKIKKWVYITWGLVLDSLYDDECKKIALSEQKVFTKKQVPERLSKSLIPFFDVLQRQVTTRNVEKDKEQKKIALPCKITVRPF